MSDLPRQGQHLFVALVSANAFVVEAGRSVIQFGVRVITKSSKAGIAGIREGALLVRLQSPPVEGAANKELIQVIAQAFGIAKREVAIVVGEHSKLKRVAIDSIDRRRFDVVLQSLGINPEHMKPSS